MKTPDRCRIGSPPGTENGPTGLYFGISCYRRATIRASPTTFHTVSELDFSHLGGKGIDTLLLDCTRSSDRGAYLLPTMVIRLLAPSMQLLFNRVANTTPGI